MLNLMECLHWQQFVASKQLNTTYFESEFKQFQQIQSSYIQKSREMWPHFILSDLNDYVLASKNKYNVLTVFELY